MLITELLPLILVAVVAANLGQVIYGYSLGRYLVAMLVAFVGASFGIGIARLFGFPELIPIVIRGEIFPVMWSIIGTATLSWMLSPFTGGRQVEVLVPEEVHHWD